MEADPLLTRVVRRCGCGGHAWPLWGRSFALGQVIALLIAGTGVSSSFLVEWGVSVPTTQSALNYALLFVTYLGYRAATRGWRSLTRLRLAWWRYALLGTLDVEANFLIVLAYRYTSITSVMLIDAWTIPCVMALSWWFLGARFQWRHFLGVGLCIVGLAVLVSSDFASAEGGGRRRQLSGGAAAAETVAGLPRAVAGDLLCFVGATLYAICNIAQEAVVKHLDRVEYLGQLGLWGTLVGALQASLLEREALAEAPWGDPWVGVALVAFASCLFAMYSATAVFLQSSDATLFNLSLLTSDVWAILAGVLLFGQHLDGLYFLALAAIVAGLLVYNCAPSPAPPAPAAASSSSSLPASGGSSPSLSSPNGAAAGAAGLDDSDGKASPLRAMALGLAARDELQMLEDGGEGEGGGGTRWAELAPSTPPVPPPPQRLGEPPVRSRSTAAGAAGPG